MTPDLQRPPRKRPPWWFKLVIWGGIASAIGVLTATFMLTAT